MTSALQQYVGNALADRSREIIRRWLDRLLERLDEEPRDVFPTDLLLDHMPDVLQSMARSLAAGDDPVCHQDVLDNLQKLARLRRQQGYSVQEILEEFHIFGRILFEAVEQEVQSFGGPDARSDAIHLAEHLYRCLLSITTCTAEAYRNESYRDRQKRAQLLGNFGRALAHELRNRLQGAQAGLHLLEHALDDDARQIFELIRHSFQGIESVADDVQALAVAQSSEESARGRQRELPDLLDHIRQELANLAQQRKVHLEIVEPIPSIQVDATRVELVLINLLGNSIKYADPKKDERWARVYVEEAPEPDFEGWRLRVEDNGVGIPRNMHRTVFEDFVRGNAPNTEGTGLGLAICREAVEQLGGKIWLESEPKKGSTFYFTVPKPSGEEPEPDGSED